MPVSKLCELFGVSRSWYYEKPSPKQKASEDVEFRDAIERIVLEFPGYGYRRVTQTLKRQGWTINHKKVLRVMRRKESLLCQLKRGFKLTTDSSHSSLKTYPNLIKDAVPVDAPNRAWSADITYVRLPANFCYLASIIDEYSRYYCVGWALSRWIDTRLTLCALRMALESRSPAAGLIHHSDQGVQYASGEYVGRLEQIGARISMAAVGNPYENAKAESFFRTLKVEEVYLNEYRTYEEAEQNIGEFIEEVYNKKRLHSSLGYLPPVEFEAQHALKARS
jgi:transposase InsO family protein